MTLDLQAIFGEPQAVAVIPEPTAALGFDPADPAAPGETPSPGSDPQAADLGPSGFDPAKWTRQPDASGRWGWQRVNLDAAGCPGFDELPNPEPCPVCGSLELWETVAADLDGVEPGRWRCLASDPPTRARGLAARAVELRRRVTERRVESCGRQHNAWMTSGENRAPDVPQDATGAAGPTQNTLGTSGP